MATNWMNVNFIRTILGGASWGTIANVAVKLSGCSWDNPATVDVIEKTTCAGSSWVPIQYQAVAAVVLMGAGGLLKAFGKSGTVKENIVNPSVPVVPPEHAKPGVVTPAQVNSSAGTNK